MATVKTTPKTLTEQVAGYALDLDYGAVPGEAVDRTKQLFLDFLGVAMGGRVLAPSGAAMVRGVEGVLSGAQGPCTVVGERGGYPPHFAALLNCAFANAMDF